MLPQWGSTSRTPPNRCIVASPFATRFLYSAFDYPTAPAAASAVEAKRDAMTVDDGELRSSGVVERA